MTKRELIDPTAEWKPTSRPRAPRPASLDGKTVGLLDISKPRGDVFLDRVAELLEVRGFGVERFRKPTFTKNASLELQHEITQRCDVVIEALAD